MPKIEVPCEHCKKPLLRWPNGLKGKKFGPFCDKDCLGKFRTAFLIGDYAANFKSGFSRDRKYIKIPAFWHPKKTKDGDVYLHRLLVEAKLGRYLEDYEIVHHKDHDPFNNQLDNLEVITQTEHINHHRKEMVEKRKRKRNERI